MPPRSKSSSPDDSPPRDDPQVTADEELFAIPRVAEHRLFTHTDPWRVLRIFGEFVDGFDELADVRAAVSMFGSARAPRDDPTYRLATETARRLGERGFAIMTGAGPGIMEAGNRGAREAKTLSIGLNIEVPHEQHSNPYVDRMVNFRYFFVRKTMLVKYSSAFIFLPGGYGTLDELFEALTLMQTGKIRDMPVVLMGAEYWQGLIDWLTAVVEAQGKISPGDLQLFHVTDSPEKVVDIVVEAWRRHQTEQLVRQRDVDV